MSKNPRERRGPCDSVYTEHIRPEAITAAASEQRALLQAQDALVVALSGYIDEGRALPRPSKPARRQPVIALPARIAFKFAIHAALKQSGLTQAQLAARLGVDGRQVRRTLDLDHESTLAQMEAALAVLGRRASLVVSKIAA